MCAGLFLMLTLLLAYGRRWQRREWSRNRGGPICPFLAQAVRVAATAPG